MRSAWTIARAASILAGLAATAMGAEPAMRDSEALVARIAGADLPARLALVDVKLPRKLASALADDAAVTWLAPARGGTQSVQVTLRGRGRELGHGWAQVKLLPLRPVLVATRAMRSGDRINGGDLAIEDRPVESEPRRMPDPDALVGARIGVELAVGERVPDGAIPLPPPLPTGTAVRLVARFGAVVATLPGQLEMPARPGENAVARVAGEGRLLRGRLGPGNTIVIEGGLP